MRVEARFLGRVQGVGFRAAAHSVATQLQIGGWVRNDPDGSVCLAAEGDEKAVRAFLEQLRQRMGHNITEESVTTTDEHRGYDGFEIRYDAPMLILFDIDATLITTSRTGIYAMADAGRSLFGPSFTEDGVEFAGRLDPLIIADLLTANGRTPTRELVASFRKAYAAALLPRLAEPGTARALPGVLDLLAALRERREITLGLLTGNYPDTGAVKLRASGVDPGWFPVQIWGDMSPHDPPSRDHLPPLGLERACALAGRTIEARDAVIIGDTPHDVRCALASGMRALGVATGMYSVAQLASAGAHRALGDLSDTREILRWLTTNNA